MSSTSVAVVPETSEKTFSKFTTEQGAHYAKHRPDYHPKLYQTVIDHHTSTGGKLDTLLDIGCGPGIAVRALAPQFKHAIGLDPSDGMISNARLLGGASSTSEPIRFEVSTAEVLGSHLNPPVPDASVDLIIAATAAHWFDMERFWARAAHVLKPGGTVAIWATGSLQVRPSMPNAEAIQATLDDIEERLLVPFFEPGNLLTRSLYAELPLPWTMTSPVAEFDGATYFRKEYGPENSDEFYPSGALTVKLDVMEAMMSSSSPVQRRRQAHPEEVGTEQDAVRQMRRGIERYLHEAGVEKGKEIVEGCLKGVLLMVKKNA